MANLLDWEKAIAAYNGGGIQPAMPVPAVDSQPVATPEVAAPATASPVLAPQAVAPAVMPTADVTNSRGAMAQMDQAAGVQAQAIQDQAAARMSGLQAQAELEGQQAQLEQQHLSQQSAAVERFQANREQLFKEYQDLNKQAEQAQVMDSRSSGQKAMGILAVALGGLGDAFSAMGGQRTNMAERIDSGIQAAVDRDLQLQMEAIRGKRAAAAAKFTELGMARSFFGDDQQAEEYARASRKEMYGKQLQAAAARAQIPQLQAAANEAAAKAISEAAEKKASLLASKENAAMNAAGRAAQGTGLKPGDIPVAQLEALERAGQITADQQQELNAARGRPTQTKALSEGQMKAQALYEASKDDAARVQDALKKGNLPGAAVARAADSSLVPDALIPDKWIQAYRSAQAIVNDDLRDESGASIGAQEKENLLAPLRSTDADVREQGYKRILAKREAMGQKVPEQARSQAPVDRVPLIRQEANASGTIRMQAPDGRMLNVPSDKVEFLKSKGAKVL